MSVPHLVTMANDISRFFESELGREKAFEGVANHIAKYWDPRMRGAIIAHLQTGGDGLADSARAAIASLPAPSR